MFTDIRTAIRTIMCRAEVIRFKKRKRNMIVFTSHKAGSMVLHRVLREVCKKDHIVYYSPNHDCIDRQLPIDQIFNGDDFIAKRNGCFGPLRFFVPTAALENANIILHLRDPRDVLTSMFFSYCYMHPGEIAPNTGYRKKAAEIGIDKFVLDMSDENFSRYQGDYGTGGCFAKYIGNVRDRYVRYCSQVMDRPNTTIISYEQMVLDFPNWLKRFLSPFELDNAEGTYQFVSSRIEIGTDVTRSQRDADPGPKNAVGDGENIYSHRRKAIPGDHKEKLKPETIAELNSRFAEVLEVLGYASPTYQVTRIPVVKC